MKRFRVPKNCSGLTLPGGFKVNANKRGVVEVPDVFAGSVRKSEAARHYGVVDVEKTTFGRSSAEDTICDKCAYSMWPWQDECPRCGHTRSPDTPPSLETGSSDDEDACVERTRKEHQMTAFARSDLMGISVAETGHAHERPLEGKGKEKTPVKVWGIDCPECEPFLFAKFPDQFAKRADAVPLTPDEKLDQEQAAKKGTVLTQQMATAMAEAAARAVVGAGQAA